MKVENVTDLLPMGEDFSCCIFDKNEWMQVHASRLTEFHKDKNYEDLSHWIPTPKIFAVLPAGLYAGEPIVMRTKIFDTFDEALSYAKSCHVLYMFFKEDETYFVRGWV